MTKPINEWSNAELRCIARDAGEYEAAFAAEVLALRDELDETREEHDWEKARAEAAEAERDRWEAAAMSPGTFGARLGARAEKAEAALARAEAELAAARGEVDLWRTRAEQAAETRNRLYSEVSGYGIRRGDNVVDLLKRAEVAEAELTALKCAGYDGDAPGIVRCGRCGEHHQPDLAPYVEEAYREHARLRAELARQKPVIDAAVRHAVDPDDWTFRALERNVGAYREGADQ
jgi:hypothetical protein